MIKNAVMSKYWWLWEYNEDKNNVLLGEIKTTVGIWRKQETMSLREYMLSFFSDITVYEKMERKNFKLSKFEITVGVDDDGMAVVTADRATLEDGGFTGMCGNGKGDPAGS